jgi:glyoxylase-like metal-dependent hydrolase (beta-lactamase superfamily II)
MSPVRALALRTPTLPPATHTNCYRVGDVLIDPASPYADEQARLLDWLRAAGPLPRRVLLTHHHHDHIGGVESYVRQSGAEVWAHRDARVPFRVDRRLEDGDVVETDGGTLTCLHTPGHADGHLVFHVESGELIAGDLVAGEGTIVVAPPEGHLATYLRSLERILPLCGALLPAHGPRLPNGGAVVRHYLAHRHARSEQVERALRDGCAQDSEIAAQVYRGIPGVDPRLAAAQVRAHLEWLGENGRARRDGERWEAA